MIRPIVSFAFALAACTGSLPLAAQVPAAAPDSIYPVTQVEVRPEALNGEELGAALFARYPQALKAAGVSGEVTVTMVVGPDGLPRDVELLSSTDTLFNAPTLEVASLLRFSPAQMGGRPVPVRIVMPVPWVASPPAAEVSGPDTTGAYLLADVEVRPRPRNMESVLEALEKTYPPALRDGGVTGTVEVRFLVSPDGTISHATVTHSTHLGFNAPSVAAVEALRFAPGKVGGRRVAVWVKLPIQWEMVRPLAPRMDSPRDPPLNERPRCVQSTKFDACP